MKLKILTHPNPILNQKSKKISRIDGEIKKLVQDMAETMKSYDTEHEIGAALAAIQVGVPLRLTVVRDEEGNFMTLINPEVVKESKDQKIDLEGCMSVPKKYGNVERPCKVKVRALNLEGQKNEIKAEGMMARILMHEIDHMNGVLFISKIVDGRLYELDTEGKLVQI